MKQHIAFLVGGMGARDANFHKAHMAAAGHMDAAERVQALFLRGRRAEAAAAVPDGYADNLALLGPPERIRERYHSWAESGITGLRIQTMEPEALELMAEIAAAVPAVGPEVAARRLGDTGQANTRT
jgi:hypothetical protein